jgi:hypothetical protein
MNSVVDDLVATGRHFGAHALDPAGACLRSATRITSS